MNTLFSKQEIDAKEMLYLASPYRSRETLEIDSSRVEQERFELNITAAKSLIEQGRKVLAPVVLCHQLIDYNLPNYKEYWQETTLKWLSGCTALVVLKIPGWKESEGLQKDILHAMDVLRMPIFETDVEGAKIGELGAPREVISLIHELKTNAR